MYIIHKAYDDFSAEVLDVTNYKTLRMTEDELLKLCNKHRVIGATVLNGEIQWLSAYSCRIVPTEEELNELLEDSDISMQNVISVNGSYAVLVESKEPPEHVDYAVYTMAGDDITYLGHSCYTKYKVSALRLKKDTAKRIAEKMTRNSKTGKHWGYDIVTA